MSEGYDWGFDIGSFHGSSAGIYHPYGEMWGKLGKGADYHHRVACVPADKDAEMYPIFSFNEEDIAKAEVKMGTLYITLRGKQEPPRFVTSTELGFTWECPESADDLPCFYDTDSDPGHDSCLRCGQPFERK